MNNGHDCDSTRVTNLKIERKWMNATQTTLFRRHGGHILICKMTHFLQDFFVSVYTATVHGGVQFQVYVMPLRMAVYNNQLED